MGEGGWAKPLAGDDELTAEEWIEQVRDSGGRMPSFSEDQVSDDIIRDMHAYLTSLTAPAQVERPEVELPENAHPGQELIVEKRCVACHGPTGPVQSFNRRAEEPTAEAVIAQLRTPRERMPMFSEGQVSDEEAAAIAEFLVSQYVPALQEVPAPLEKAMTAIGGAEALQGLNAFTLQATGTRSILDEAFSPGAPAGVIGDYSLQMTYDLAGDRMRLDYTRQAANGERQVSEVIAGELGYIDGQDAAFGEPGIKPMTSDRWASTRKQQRLLNPHLILLDIAADPSIVTEDGEEILDGMVHHRLVITDDIAPITLYVSAGTGHIAKLSTMENDHLRRDVPLEAFYYNWQMVGDTLSFPAEVYLALDGEIVLEEIRSSVNLNQASDDAMFEIPADVEPVFDEELAMRGELSHQFNQLFAANGFIKDGAQTEINAEEIAPGIYQLGGVANNSLVVEQANGIVVLDAPLHQYRSEAIIEWINQTFPGKPISHVVSTHHHTDHSAGLRTFVAQGATIVLGEAAQPFFEEIFQASSTISPDALAENPVEAQIEVVPADGSFTIPDDEHPVEVYPIENTHAEDMVIAYVGNPGVVFVSDLYSPNPGADPGAGGALLRDTIDSLGLDVSLIAGGHGTSIAFEEFTGLLGE
jgi:mono/diheme cytochrome c family protein/glyoxylase-like metal-dependent hydrolase (beta-lactamase superfamily II)